MTKDEACLKMGREVMRMVSDLRHAAGSDAGYARRSVTFADGSEVQLFIVNKSALADAFEQEAARQYDVLDVVPASKTN
jgi:hypothetical protein